MTMRQMRVSLLELGATALIVLLLAGLIIHGERAIWAQRSQMVVSDLKAYAQAVEQFQRQNGRLPGDLDRDGKMDDADALTELEEQNLAYLKLSSFGTAYRIGWIAALPTPNGYAPGNGIQVSGIPLTVARQVDHRLDQTPPGQAEIGRKTGKVRYIIAQRHATLFYLLDETP